MLTEAGLMLQGKSGTLVEQTRVAAAAMSVPGTT
jgi:hypothetical protein